MPILALVAAALDVYLGITRHGGWVKIGGYYGALAARQQTKSDVVMLDMSTFVEQAQSQDPQTADDPDWNRVARNWRNTAAVVKGLARAGAKAVVLDYDLALSDYYLAPRSKSLQADPFFDVDAISEPARNEYIRLMKTLDEVDRSGTVVAFGADGMNARNEAVVQRPFATVGLERMAGTLAAPGKTVGDYFATSYASRDRNTSLPSLSDIVSRRLGDKLKSPSPWPGMSPYAIEIEEEEAQRGDESWRQFWVDFGLVSLRPVDFAGVGDLGDAELSRQVNGKAVVVGDIERRETQDVAIMPKQGIAAGCFHHASAIATRVFNPIYAPATMWVEGTYLFLASLILGYSSLGLALGITRLFRIGEYTRAAEWIDVVCECAVLTLTLCGAYWLITHLSVHRLLLPMLTILLIVRFVELVVLVRNAVFQTRSEH